MVILGFIFHFFVLTRRLGRRSQDRRPDRRSASAQFSVCARENIFFIIFFAESVRPSVGRV